MIIKNDPLIKLSVSATTRAKRSQEVDGKHYFFIDQNKFEEMKNNNEFIEYANVFDNYYGTPKKMVENCLKNGEEVLFDIDWQGARQIKEKYDKDSIISIFILPPSLQELERRLKNRAQDPEEVVKQRMSEAVDEINHHGEYDYILINDDLNSTYNKIRSIIEAKRVARLSKEQINDFVKKFS